MSNKNADVIEQQQPQPDHQGHQVALPQDRLRVALEGLISTSVVSVRHAVDDLYDAEATLQNPYLLLTSRASILDSYVALAASNCDLRCDIHTITYDATSQTAMVDMTVHSLPKALGGLVPIKIHQILKLQMERADDGGDGGGRLVVVHHHEVHVAQDYLAQLPLVGGFYDTSLRSAIGGITLAGSAVLQYTGLLDAVPRGVEIARSAVGATRAKVGEMVRGTLALGGSVAHATGVDKVYKAGNSLVHSALSTVEWAAGEARDTAASLIEEGKGVHVDCYVPTCRPGQICYSPTCPRGRTLTTSLSIDNVKSVVRGMYIEGGRRTGFFQVHS